ncbi:MAG: PD-(D/E)XK nuclease family protein [Bacilli bacterium]|nr:PD-(D/E)XK nuclease family protein [Bacilli bacterium]
MTKFLINKINGNNCKNISKQIGNDKTIIITSNNKVTQYKKYFSNYDNVIVYDLKTFIYQTYQKYINKLPVINSNEQTLFFIKAIKESNANLNYLGNHSFDMIDDLINIYKFETNHQLTKSNYQTKLTHDIETIIDKYLELISNSYIDEQILYKTVNDYLINHHDYKDTNIVISDLYIINNIEKDLIKNLINNSQNGYLYFLTDQEIPGMEIHFDAFNYFKNAFKDNIEIEVINNNEDPEKDFIINNLYKLNNELSDKSGYFKIYGASDLYDEVVFVANQISELIRTENFRYGDFAIVSNSITDYENYFDLIFSDNNIPYHKKENINSNFLDYILNLLDIMNDNISETTLINIIKSGYYNIFDYQINQVVDLIIKTNNTDLEDLEPNLKNYIHNSILKSLYIENKKINTNELLFIIYNHLDNFKIPTYINKNDNETWVEFINIMNNISSVYKNDIIRVEELKDIFSYFFKKINVQNHHLDEVLIGDTSIINGLKPKVVFFIGVNEGIVPKKISENILLNNSVLSAYYKNYPKFNNILIDKFRTFYTITCPSEYLFITYYKVSKNGSKTNPAPIIEKIKSMYKEITIYNKEGIINTVSLKNLTFNHYLNFNNAKLKEYLKTYFENHDYYKNYNKLINYIPSFYSVDKINLEHLTNLSLSPSSMDTYNYCPFQYFCKYILKLDEIEIEKYDNRIAGTYIHYLFEKLISNKATKDNIIGLLKFWKLEFIKEKDFKLNATTDYMFDKLNDTVRILWPFIYDDIYKNKFVPHKLELNISKDEEFLPLVLNYNNIPIYLRGIIDRVDLYDHYVRVIDYKTGSKKVVLNEIANGLNLQLFIYLQFIYKSRPELIPSGLFYMPSLVKYEDEEFNPKNYRLTGMLLNNKEVIDGLGGDNINNYIDAYTRDKFKPNVLIDKEDMDSILNFTEKTIIKTAKNILEGQIEIKPFKDNNFCKYCPYLAICGIEEGSQNYRKLKKYDKDEIWSLIRGEIDEMD